MGPVRNLKCDYDSLQKEEFNCSWIAPADLHGDIRNYSVKVKLEDEFVYSDFTNFCNYTKEYAFNGVRGFNYEVIVNALTPIEGTPSSTGINFINSGGFSI